MLNRAKIIFFALLLVGVVSPLAFVLPAITRANVNASSAYPLLTPTPSIPIEQTTPSGPPLSLTLSMLCFCLVLLLIVGVFVLGIVARRQGSTDDKI